MRVAIPGAASLASLVLLVACESASHPAAPKPQAMSFANSEWSEPVHLDAPVNSRCQDQTPRRTPRATRLTRALVPWRRVRISW